MADERDDEGSSELDVREGVRPRVWSETPTAERRACSVIAIPHTPKPLNRLGVITTYVQGAYIGYRGRSPKSDNVRRAGNTLDLQMLASGGLRKLLGSASRRLRLLHLDAACHMYTRPSNMSLRHQPMRNPIPVSEPIYRPAFGLILPDRCDFPRT